MANTAVTLTSNTVATVTVEGDHEAIEVVQLAGTPVAVYYTIGTIASSTPNPAVGTIGAGAGGSFVLPAWDRALSDADVALLSAGFPVVP